MSAPHFCGDKFTSAEAGASMTTQIGQFELLILGYRIRYPAWSEKNSVSNSSQPELSLSCFNLSAYVNSKNFKIIGNFACILMHIVIYCNILMTKLLVHIQCNNHSFMATHIKIYV